MAEENVHQKFIDAYEKYSDQIFCHLFFRIYDRDIAKELMQDTFTKTWDYLASNKKVDNLRAFLYKVAKNLLVSHVRKKKEKSLDELLAQGFFFATKDEENLTTQIDGKILIKTINELPKKYSDVIKMRFIEDLSPKEIAEIIGGSENRVSVKINRSLKQLKKIIKYQQ